MTSTERLLEIADALDEADLPFLVMGGHAVRFYGLERNTVDFDFCLSLTAEPALEQRTFDQLFARREEGWIMRRKVAFLCLEDLIRSKETERDEDWKDVSA